MARSALVRSGIAAFALFVGALPLTAPAHAETVSETVIPATAQVTPRIAYVQSAGATGFLEYRYAASGSGRLYWTGYDGTRREVAGTEGVGTGTNGKYGASSDVVALQNGDEVLLRDMSTGAEETITRPAGQSYMRTYGSTVLTGVTDSSGNRTALHLLREEAGATVDLPVTGLPDGTVIPVHPLDGDADGLLLYVQLPGSTVFRCAWVDLGSGVATVLPSGVAYSDSVVNGHYLTSWAPSKTIQVFANGSYDSPVRTVQLADRTDTALLGTVGDAAIIARHIADYGKDYASENRPVWRISAVPFDGSAERVLATRASKTVSSAPDGSLVFAGGESAADYGIATITADADGHPQVRRVVDLASVPMSVESLDLTGGQLSTFEYGDYATRLFSRSVLDSGELTVGTRAERGSITKCWAAYSPCPALTGNGDGRLFYGTLSSSGSGEQKSIYALEPGQSLPATEIATAATYDAVKDASGRYAVWKEYTGSGDIQLVVKNLDSGTTVLTRTGDQVPDAEALWGGTLWSQRGGTLTATDILTHETITTASLGALCTTPSTYEIKSVGRWVLWRGYCSLSSGGGETKSFVYDTRKRTWISVPYATSTGLGDGFVVTGRLTITDLTTGSAVSRQLDVTAARLDVDPYTGLIAYVDPATQDIHVVPSGIPATALSVLGSTPDASVDLKAASPSWDGKWWLSKPAASWTLAFKNKATGTTVRTLSGTGAADTIEASWNGRTSAGVYAPNGTYTWTLVAQPADGSGSAVTQSGTLKLTGGAAVRRDHAGSDGFGDLLTLSSSGALTFQKGTGTGKFSGTVSASGWPASVKAVPFGDLSGDRCNDVLVRLANGSMRAYRPGCGKALTTSTAYTSLGTGWNQYDLLTSPGDLTGDGRADLIARNSSTGAVYLYKATSAGKLSARVKLYSNWKTYKKIVGAGDLNGDGFGDLLAQDKSNVLWRYNGTGTGGFKSRVKVASGWGASYNAVVGVGDITGDGKADLVARDTSGNLWRQSGNGKGGFAARTKIATGWKAYKGLF